MDTMPTIRELMRPVDEFPTISEHSFFFDIIMALEKTHGDNQADPSRPTALLVEDMGRNIIGIISPMDVVRALEPQYDKINSFKDDIRFGLPQVVESMKRDYFLWQEPFSDLCGKAWKIKAGDICGKPSSTQSMGINERMENAFHLFVTTRHEYIFVIENERVVGLLRFFDIYQFVCQKISLCAGKSSF